MSERWKKFNEIVKNREFFDWESVDSPQKCPVCNAAMRRYYKGKTHFLYCKFCDIAPSGALDLDILDENSGEKPVEKV